MPVPSSLVAPLRAALQSQGFPSGAVDDAGNVDAGKLFGGVFNKATVRTRLFPPIPLDTADTISGPPGFWARLIQPEVVFEGRFGTTTYAPYGSPGANQGWLWATVIVLGLVGFGYALGRSKR